MANKKEKKAQYKWLKQIYAEIDGINARLAVLEFQIGELKEWLTQTLGK